MRTIVILFMLLGLAVSLASAVDPTDPLGSETILSSSRSSPGSTIVTLHDDSERPFSQPILRFVALPPAAAQPRARLLNAEQAVDLPADVSLGTPMIMRGLQLLPVVVTPKTDPAAKNPTPMPGTIEIDIRYDEGRPLQQEPSAPLRHSRGFFDALEGLVPAEQLSFLRSADEGSYLIITDPQFRSIVEPLADWKRAKGFHVILTTTQEIDPVITSEKIQQYISRAYHESPNPPQYVLLVGDVPDLSYTPGVPGWDYHGVVSDLPYALIDGDDILPDLSIGRLSVRTADQAQTVIAKILHYEQTPYTEGGTDWFSRALMIATTEGNSSAVATLRWCGNRLLDTKFSEVDSFYCPTPSCRDPHSRPIVREKINRGVSVVAYRGWAQAEKGWDEPYFLQGDIDGLANGWMLPVVFDFVCENNAFSYPECFGEAWIRSGSATVPKGAVAFVGNGEPWSHTRFNDVAAIGTFKAIRNGSRRLGEILNSFKLEWFTQFPSEIPYEGAGRESVEFYYYIYNLLGDPEMAIWTAMPEPIAVSFLNPIPQGSNFLDVSVTETQGGGPVAGARVGISQGQTVIGTAWTEADGIARVPGSFEETGEPVVLTVTGAGVAPYIGSASVVVGGPFLSYEGLTIDDDNTGASQGNGDGIANPAEKIELHVSLRNRGASAATAIHATLTPAQGVEVETAGVDFPTIPAGEAATSTEPFVIRIDPWAEDGLVARLRIDAVAGTEHSVSDLVLTIRAPALRNESAVLDGDGLLLPGQTGDLTVTLRNDGSIASSSVSAILRSSAPDLVAVTDSVALFLPIQPGAKGTAAAPFAVRAASDAGIGRVVGLTLTLSSPDGPVSETSFSLTIGAVSHTSPLGPDGYGYCAYDNTDTDYPDAVPTYDWVTCSSAYGGPGTRLTLGDNETVTLDLPFTFTYYGRPYDRIAVSDNGWISFNTSYYYDYFNWHMPNVYGPGSMIAPFWDNLDPTRKRYRRGPLMGDGVYVLSDPTKHRFVIEWSRLPNYITDFDDLQTFELILYDPEFYPAPDGNGIIDFQYKQITNNDAERMYATVGIQDEGGVTGLEYTYSNLYPQAAAPLAAGLAIRITTKPPRYSPFHLSEFSAIPSGPGVMLSWTPGDERLRGGYRIYRGALGGTYALLNGETLDAAVRSFLDQDANPDSTYAYKIGSLDPFGRETLIGPFAYLGKGSGAPRVALEARTPNPFRGSVELTYALPKRGFVALQIHDLSGRSVRKLVSGVTEAGIWTATWDGRDDGGRDQASGVYLCKLDVGSERRSLKLTLLR